MFPFGHLFKEMEIISWETGISVNGLGFQDLAFFRSDRCLCVCLSGFPSPLVKQLVDLGLLESGMCKGSSSSNSGRTLGLSQKPSIPWLLPLFKAL